MSWHCWVRATVCGVTWSITEQEILQYMDDEELEETWEPGRPTLRVTKPHSTGLSKKSAAETHQSDKWNSTRGVSSLNVHVIIKANSVAMHLWSCCIGCCGNVLTCAPYRLMNWNTAADKYLLMNTMQDLWEKYIKGLIGNGEVRLSGDYPPCVHRPHEPKVLEVAIWEHFHLCRARTWWAHILTVFHHHNKWVARSIVKQVQREILAVGILEWGFRWHMVSILLSTITPQVIIGTRTRFLSKARGMPTKKLRGL